MFGNSARAKTRDIETPGPDYPEEYPEYSGKSGVSGSNTGVSGYFRKFRVPNPEVPVSLAPEFEIEF